MSEQFTFPHNMAPTRLDRAIRNHFPQWGRRAVQAVVNAGDVSVNGRRVWLCSWTVHGGDRIEIHNPPANKPAETAAFDPNWLLYEDANLVVVNKPAGLLAEPTRWTERANLLDLAQGHFGSLTLFHRLDRDTSGVLLLSRTSAANRYLARVFQKRLVEKEYKAVVTLPNQLEPTGTISAHLAPHPQRRDMMTVVPPQRKHGGKPAITRYRIDAELDGVQWLTLWPETGRTHQLRVHLAHVGASICGDRLYSTDARAAPRLMLHAYCITLPALDDFPSHIFIAPLPRDFSKLDPP